MMSEYYNTKRCKTCKWWLPFNGVCTNGDSEHRADYTDRDDDCDHWEANRHKGCGGLMEAREHGGVIEHYCFGCMFTVMIDGKPILETREHLMKEGRT
jgi:hypothetical protein